MKPAMIQRLLLAACLAISFTALAESGNAEAGHKKSTACQVCHGPTGISISPAFPNLAGQNFDYLVASLHHYKNGKRKNPIMQAQVGSLTERDIEDVAAYFSSQRGLTTKY
jgi:cytochrome c553